MSSNRTFGLVFAVMFGAVALFPLTDNGPPRLWALGALVLLSVVTLLKPHWLTPFNRIWFHFGQFLHRTMSPVVLAVIFFVVITPTGLFVRFLGKDPLYLRFDAHASSYWIHRDPPGPDPGTMTRQF